MTIILLLLAVSLTIGASGLVCFLWSLWAGQYDDLNGGANRILFDETGFGGARSDDAVSKTAVAESQPIL